MFIKCSKKVKFVCPDNPKVTWEMDPGFIGDVPSWVEKDWYFKALCEDGSITAIKSHSDRDIQDATDDKGEDAAGDKGEEPPTSAGETPPPDDDKGEESAGDKPARRGRGNK